MTRRASMALLLACTIYTSALGQKAPGPHLQPAINNAIDRGVEVLLSMQNRDGSWNPSNFEGSPHWDHRNAQTGFTLYTLLKCKVSPDHPAVQRALLYLLSGFPDKTYSIAVQMMALAATGDGRHVERLEELLEALMDLRGRGARSWPYPGLRATGGDLSNSQYAALGIRAAQQAGVRIPSRVWLELVEATLEHRGPGQTLESGALARGFDYDLKHGVSASMTTAGVGILCLAREGSGGKLPNKWSRPVQRAIDEGLEWLTSPFNVSENRGGSAAWHYYYLYGLERIGSVGDMQEFNGINWYWIGAEWLVKNQNSDGTWRTSGDTTSSWPPTPMVEANTCFALLFLRKASAPTSGQGGKREGLYAMEDESSTVWLRASGRGTLTLWVSGFAEGVVARYTEQGGLVEGLRVSEVRYLLDGQVVTKQVGDINEAWNGQRYAVQQAIPGGGSHEVAVEVDVLRPAGEALEGESAVVTLRSRPLKIRTEGVLLPWMREYAQAGPRGLFANARVTARESSRLSDRWGGAEAVDGIQFSAWITKENDKDPTLTLEFARPVRANTLLLSPIDSSEFNAKRYARPTKVELWVNKEREPRVVELLDSLDRKTQVALGKTMSIRRLVLRVVETRRGQSGLSTGFAEVEGVMLR